MNHEKKSKLNYIVLILILVVVFFTIFKICTDTTQNAAFGISGKADDKIRMTDSCCLELELDAPRSGLTGFSFRFTGNNESFGDSAFLVTAAVQNDSLAPQILYTNRAALNEQVYDYQQYSRIVIIPFEGYVDKGDHLRITILGIGMSEEDNIAVQISSQPALGDAVLEINDVVQDSTLAGQFYYQTRKLVIFPTMMQGIVCVLFILLVWESLKRVIKQDASEKQPVTDIRIPLVKRILKSLPIMILVAAALDYTYYAGAKMQMEDYNLSLKLKLLFIVLSGLIIGLTFIVFSYGQYKLKWEKFFFFILVCLGILFEIVITPYAVPDEASHIDTAYRISNELLGTEDTQILHAIYKRECDIYTDIDEKIVISWGTYQWIYRNRIMPEGGGSEKLAFAADNRNNANSLFFLPAAIGITIGRILGMGFSLTIYLARTVNLLLAAWMIYLAVKKIPYGKSILCMIALLPITIQEIASCSYDALIIPISMLFVSYCVFAIYSEAKLERIDILVILITAVMLAICKGGVYTPLYLLGLWILIKRGYIRFPRKKGTRIAGIAAVTFMVLAGIVGVVYLYRQPANVNAGSFYSLPYLIQHPWKTFRIAENSLYRDTYYYIEQLFGKTMGSFQISVKFIVPLGYMILLGRTVVCDERYPYIPDVLDKCVFMITAALVFAAVQAAFLFSVTNIESYSIGGVQGRYFLQMIWPFLICFRRNNVVYKNKNYTGFVLAAYLLGICTVLQIVISAFNPGA